MKQIVYARGVSSKRQPLYISFYSCNSDTPRAANGPSWRLCRWIIGGKMQQLRMTSGNGNNNGGGGDAFRFATVYFSNERLPRRNFEFHFGATDSTSVSVGLSVVHGRARKTTTGICSYGQKIKWLYFCTFSSERTLSYLIHFVPFSLAITLVFVKVV